MTQFNQIDFDVPSSRNTSEFLVEDEEKDKSRLYGLDVPVGTWMGAVKVNNDEIWDEYVKTGKVKGFSIEGYFADKAQRPKDQTINDLAKIEEDRPF